MTISATEKRLFDAIDGSRTIGDILGIGLPSWQEKLQLDMARTFFERLWWHDQVVFDASATQGRTTTISQRPLKMGKA